MAYKTKRPRITFKKRRGGVFTKTFKSRASASRALRGWRSAGGKIARGSR